MTFDPSVRPPEYARLLTEAGIAYEESELPRIAIAPPGFNPDIATLWARSHYELMMLRDLDGQWILFYFAANNTVKSDKFPGTTVPHVAASQMREWLDDKGLILPDDLKN
jgi:hypothetical protein